MIFFYFNLVIKIEVFLLNLVFFTNIHFIYYKIFTFVLLIHVSNIIDINMKSKVLKHLKDNAESKLIVKIIDSRSRHLIIKKMSMIFKIPNL